MKPILFNTEMVRAILDGQKTVTRRVALKADELREFPCASYPDGWWFRGRVYANREKAMKAVEGVMSLCKYRPGDTLWVRETWCVQSAHGFECDIKIGYKAGGCCHKMQFKNRADYDAFVFNKRIGDGKWYPSIHMPREAARIFLRVKDVRVERLQSISHEDAEQEGCWCDEGGLSMPIDKFADLWDRTLKPADQHTYGWDANPWVWVIEFERIGKEDAS